jgi:hypothetical protein
MRPDLRGLGRLLACIVLLASAAWSPAQGAQLFSELTTFAELGWSDNVTGVATGQQSETIGAVGLRGRASNDGRRAELDAVFDLSYVNYLGGEYSDRLTGSADVEARLAVVPDRIWFVVEDWFGQTQSQPFAPPTFENQENTNILAGGIDARQGLVGNLVFLASGRYVIESYQRTAADNERWQGVAGVHYEFSPRTSLGVLVQARDVTYSDSAPYDNFSVRELLLRYRIAAPRTTLQLDGGRSQYRGRDALRTRRNMWAGSLAVSRNLTPRTSVNLALGREISDGGDMFVNALDGPGGQENLRRASLSTVPTGGAAVVASGDALRSTFLRAGWSLSARRTDFRLGAELRQERYIGATTADRDAYSAYVGMTRRLSPRFSLDLDFTGTTREQVATGEKFDDIRGTLGAQYQATPRSAVGVSYEHFKQVGGNGFTDRRAWLRFSYSPITATQR